MTTETILWIVYIIGFVCAYILTKYIRRGENSNWSDIFASFFLSLLSWVFVIIAGTTELESKIKIKNFKPPKWL